MLKFPRCFPCSVGSIHLFICLFTYLLLYFLFPPLPRASIWCSGLFPTVILSSHQLLCGQELCCQKTSVFICYIERQSFPEKYIYCSTSNYFLLLTDIGNLKLLIQEIELNENDVVMGSPCVFLFLCSLTSILSFSSSLFKKKILIFPSAQSTYVTPSKI